MTTSKKCIGLKVIAIIAIFFGILTLKSGGEVLFFDGEGRAAAGNFVPFVLWSNFLLGFLYIISGIGLWLQKSWAVWLAVFITATTLVVFIAFSWYINNGGLFEARTMKAMILRSSVWSFISTVSFIRLIRQGLAN